MDDRLYEDPRVVVNRELALIPRYEDEVQVDDLVLRTGSTPVGLRSDAGKARVDLLDTEFLEGVGQVLGFGAVKYAAHNWRNGISASRTIASTLRHLFAWMRGQDNDPESGLNHLLHVGCNVMFLYWTVKHKPQFDDRFKG